MDTHRSLKPARYAESQVPDYNMSRVGEVLPGVLNGIGENEKFAVDVGDREKDEVRIPSGRAARGESKPRKRLSPTNSERLNRAFVELGQAAFIIHMLLWKWRGAPHKGLLPFFTCKSVGRFCRMDPKTARNGLRELIAKGWIRPERYNPHAKNTLYRLIPIRDILKPCDRGKKATC
ncbi:hypothetical protein ES703_115434 [subsurface metagenome]